jgi:hypothetical protein
VQHLLGSEADRLARETGFIQRERAVSGADFAQAMIFGWLQPTFRKDAYSYRVFSQEGPF